MSLSKLLKYFPTSWVPTLFSVPIECYDGPTDPILVAIFVAFFVIYFEERAA